MGIETTAVYDPSTQVWAGQHFDRKLPRWHAALHSHASTCRPLGPPILFLRSLS
jgi:hypothetical protein